MKFKIRFTISSYCLNTILSKSALQGHRFSGSCQGTGCLINDFIHQLPDRHYSVNPGYIAARKDNSVFHMARYRLLESLAYAVWRVGRGAGFQAEIVTLDRDSIATQHPLGKVCFDNPSGHADRAFYNLNVLGCRRDI